MGCGSSSEDSGGNTAAPAPAKRSGGYTPSKIDIPVAAGTVSNTTGLSFQPNKCHLFVCLFVCLFCLFVRTWLQQIASRVPAGPGQTNLRWRQRRRIQGFHAQENEARAMGKQCAAVPNARGRWKCGGLQSRHRTLEGHPRRTRLTTSNLHYCPRQWMACM